MTKGEIQAMVDGIVAASDIKIDAIGRVLDVLKGLTDAARARADASYQAYENASGADDRPLELAHIADSEELQAYVAAYEGAVTALTAARRELADSMAYVERAYGVEINSEYRVLA